jgi:hypothetical protein
LINLPKTAYTYRKAHIVCPCTENSPDGRGDF